MRSHFTTHQLRFVANGGSGGSRLPRDSGWGKDHHYGTREQADEILKSHNVSLKARQRVLLESDAANRHFGSGREINGQQKQETMKWSYC